MAAEDCSNRGALAELGRFLRACRARTRPEDAGLAFGVGSRRTPGLRREEVATLAGISIDYYARLERGKGSRLSPGIVDGLARALSLDDGERLHLRELVVRTACSPTAPIPNGRQVVGPATALVLEALRPYPAFVVNRTMDLLAWNPGGLALHAGLAEWPAAQRNLARYLMLHPQARELLPAWEEQVRSCVARIRAQVALEPEAPDLASLVKDLLKHSADFAELWDRYEMVGREAPELNFRHPAVGSLVLSGQSMRINDAIGQEMAVYTAELATPDYESLLLLDASGVPVGLQK
ncbi:helix-turn-helix transcriptional regulator [Streptomyces parvulus]|uniref:XRE family transcriptional regulator n=1 Tax=Streptomyces parvulus TaxID=146923 RepID=A0A369V434_9ACTN|nr:helix-turn-helix transcriptional regulator [Streptomyces parvulus]RDD85319.1 XRE family transcriptional regulator [Streptomyces parvulus]